MQNSLLVLLKLLSILLAISCTSCGGKEEVQPDLGKEKNQQDYLRSNIFKRDIKLFTEHFKISKTKFDQITWTNSKGPFALSLSNNKLQLALDLLELGELSESQLTSNFDSAYYYLDQVRIKKKYNNVPIPAEVLKFIAKFLTGRFDLMKDQKIGNEYGLRTYSSILRLIEEIESIGDLPHNLIQHYAKMPLDKIKTIITKNSYDVALEKYSKLKELTQSRDAYPILKCNQYWAIAPIMNIDARYEKDLVRLTRIAENVNILFTKPERYLVGNLSDHLRCVETVEEVLGRQPDTQTGEGLFDKYYNFIIKNLWDYPLYGKQCAPFRGVLGSFQAQTMAPKDYCKRNFKSVSDNMYLAYLIQRYEVIENPSAQGDSLFKKGVGMRRILKAEATLEGILNKPDPSPTPTVQASKAVIPVVKKKISKK